MSKSKAMLYAAVAALVACLFLPMQLYACFWVFLFVAAIYGCIGYYKHRRDSRLVQQVLQEQATASHELVLPPMTSKGSNRLFVPPPLDNHQ